MKTKVLLIAGAVAIVGTGVVMHTGPKPKCPLQMLMHEKKSEEKPKTAAIDPIRTGHMPGEAVKPELAHK
jgi:hypothetical protein